MQQRNTIYVPAGGGEQLDILGMTHFTKVTPEDTGGEFTALVIEVPPECGPPMHSHAGDSEFFFVLEGTLTISDPEGDIQAKPGDFVYLRAGGSHAFRNNSDRPVRALAMVTPGHSAHRFFTQVHARLAGAVDVPVVLDIATQNGMAFVQ